MCRISVKGFVHEILEHQWHLMILASTRHWFHIWVESQRLCLSRVSEVFLSIITSEREREVRAQTAVRLFTVI